MISKLIRFVGAVTLCLTVVGCSDGPRRAAPVEPDKALAALRSTLDVWKAGQKIESLGNENPPIVAQDFDWMAGAKLTEYKLLNDGTPEDANLRVQVQITVRDAQGRTATKTVTYVVGTDPKLTVFRALE
ncbi:Uncharacterized protein OS=Singulisphaera acidiphila (strain ATCC BAA-1392 / DSM 18658 / VKM B-2454 / MOB10) GN=Sinac_4926 PE=4 SV=1 [Gemmata massiliana]|uniref:Lipoprotein n=1 Tax=Gemmata massiliana TaxID=1210884 RepID=A0A6P2D578_9BACT|nr:hypothetical protein [Gemmata massiliana]VTR95636.1 Uncharacterized protein OS=Singulisphaera acidiphila (strain ATCC BAA-1392 / DSM 18658 / VKM B-2454 / MOB10) GN=Sinac_4926 PE=4 SV=1 [Gemmata massiliana]